MFIVVEHRDFEGLEGEFYTQMNSATLDMKKI
jgi:hypothetical protein